MTKKNSTPTNHYFTLDFPEKTIWGSRTSFDRAGKGVKSYYQELTRLMKEQPTFECKVKEIQKKHDKKIWAGLTLTLMKEYITLVLKSNRLLNEYNSRIAYAKENEEALYPTMKKWFIQLVGKDFDVEKTKEQVKEAKMKNTLLNANEEETEEAA